MPEKRRISGSLSPATIWLIVVHYTAYLVLSQLCRANTLLPNQTMDRRGQVNTVSESKLMTQPIWMFMLKLWQDVPLHHCRRQKS